MSVQPSRAFPGVLAAMGKWFSALHPCQEVSARKSSLTFKCKGLGL